MHQDLLHVALHGEEVRAVLIEVDPGNEENGEDDGYEHHLEGENDHGSTNANPGGWGKVSIVAQSV